MAINLSTLGVDNLKKIVIHLISDSSGQTVRHAARSAILHFPEVEAKYYNWPLIRNKELLDEVLEKIKNKPGIVLHTLSDPTLIEILEKLCRKLKLPCITVIGKIIKEISAFIGTGAENSVSLAYRLDESYFEKMEAIDYTLRHDDGSLLNNLDEADIILIGPSRTSKTPTAVYLSYNGFKTANIPYIYGHSFSDDLEKKLNNLFVVGLIINPNILIEIRTSRLNLLQITSLPNYTDLKTAKEECKGVKKLCMQNNWPVIDVSRRSIEETAAIIMKIYYEKKLNHKS